MDVYSYGIVVLEMLTGKGPTTDIQAVDETEKTENRGLVSWVRENMPHILSLFVLTEVGLSVLPSGGKGSSDGIESSLEKIMDPSMEGAYDMMTMAKLLVAAMKCVEEKKGARPAHNSQVVEMLQDNH
ncbi:hypothetical protein FEM48_Zijuj06G0037400 [Ziziphus jujuba var. spinosa]|uniref:Uncharacterized protein n=1 Tax=Ziziphus jujuba var. spinosa TaxID=714518 RepID=A0A978V6Z4_ZIZJJ|nr:hypothetical protein FEM48_Zijuj06G0037400 [Ziziphus jujuba var. spinosa]